MCVVLEEILYRYTVPTFFSSDKSMPPYNYYLCRSDKQTKERHLSKAHSGIKMHLIQFVDATAPIAAEALHAYKSICLKKLDITKEATNSSASEISLSPLLQQNEKTHFDSFLLNDQSKSFDETSIGSHSTVDEKMDMVVTMLKDLSTKMEQGKNPSSNCSTSDISVLVNELNADKDTHSGNAAVDWSKIENIIQLTEIVKSVRFFATDGQNQKGCVRCQVCFQYLSSRDNHLKRFDLTRIEEDRGGSVASHIKK